ncbi:Cysteine-rich venom protein like [Actinidia chinensis var. chinensis]|uniref:Cysteine-rich venom protein like n=1 Tax=Actinidia chinensis var. chinensis TaxID=1590841 RepID=A0A2R6QPE9_ACTCC|nr:Cysteine-rich venom protein like [Actinidia chinensis var. chinensis]
MQRQSLGSPGSKLHIHGELGANEENLTGKDQKRKDQASSLAADADEDNDKSQKPHKSSPKPEKFIHLIPILTVLCFLVLYLSSHDPSQTGKRRLGLAAIGDLDLPQL